MRSVLAGPMFAWLAASFAAAQAPVEVVGEHDLPSVALSAQLARGEDDFVLFDVGYAIRSAVIRMHRDWLYLEGTRARQLVAMLTAMRERWSAGPGTAEAKACAAVVSVALALWHDELTEEPMAMEPGAARDERDEVLAAASGRLRFVEGEPVISWRAAAPPRDYESMLDRDGELAGVFRATIYLREYLARWPAPLRRAWADAVEQQRGSQPFGQLQRVAAAMQELLGVSTPMPGLIGTDLFPDVARLLRLSAKEREPWRRLERAFAGDAAAEPKSVRAGILALVHALVTAPTDEELLRAMSPAQWRAKWLDAAAFHYVGLRQIDHLVNQMCEAPNNRLPRVVVEPVPEAWAALRCIDRLQDRVSEALRGEPPGPARRDWYDDVIEALDRQTKGESLAAHLEARLLEKLLSDFKEPDSALGNEVEIEGIAGRFRRAAPQLVRVPIRWRGETRKALALRLFVEHESSPGVWQGPPWGTAIDADAAVRALSAK